MYKGTMTIEQALEAMKAGHKVANSYFTSGEYLTCQVMRGQYIDDFGNLVVDEMVQIFDESGCHFNSWFFAEDGIGVGAKPSFKNTGFCWLIRE